MQKNPDIKDKKGQGHSSIAFIFILIFNLKLFSVLTTWDIAEHTSYHSVLYSLAGMLCMQVKHVTLSPCRQQSQADN